MNDQLQTQLANILTSISTGIQATGSFVLEQLPDVAQQALVYGRITNTIGLVVALILLVVTISYIRWVRRLSYNDYWPRDVPIILAMIGALITTIALGAAVPATVLVWFAPKLWLLQQLSQLVKG